jgi:hypothetical protein
MMADLHGALDLAALANELNEPADLLESADDAPIIRLINALLGEAIVEGGVGGVVGGVGVVGGLFLGARATVAASS